MKKLISQGLITVLALSGLFATSVQAASYTWVNNPRPPLRFGMKRALLTGSFTVPDSVVATGVIQPSDVTSMFFKVLSPAYYFYTSFDGGQLMVDPVTGMITGGSLHSTDPYSTYGHGATFYANRMAEDNPLGGSWSGHWVVTF